MTWCTSADAEAVRLAAPGRIAVGVLVLGEIPDVQEVQATLFQPVGDEHQRLAREEN